MSSSKSKWDQPGPVNDDKSASDSTTKDGKSASDAAAAAAAIAAKIAAQFASGALKDEGAFQKDIDINDVRNRYMLTKGSTQQEIHDQTGASVSTKGVWYPDRSKATEKDPPLYLHITASTQEALQQAVDKVNDLISTDLGPLVEDKKDRLREKRKWPEEKLTVGLESIRNFNVRTKVVGPSGSFVKYIQQETGTRVQIKGVGSGFIEQETGQESNEPLYIHITGPDESQVQRAKVLAEDLLLVVREEHAKMQTALQHQQMELHQAQAQYAAYSAMAAGYAPPQPANAPPPPPGEQPPPPADGAPAPPGGANPAGADPSNQEAFAAYWAAYGYDVNSQEFKDWAAGLQSQYTQYYTGQGQPGADAGGVPGYAPPGGAPPPPPPSSEAPPPPPPA
ncbi:hypothetical protein D9756_002194 [Leucocoprinus leucothites]|uniref:K Homology domain-containing protein n=1 Tax=Leucocoprinus leucothites TaxID=201217 RepID=A0A8H5GBP3_9AGAR|nr:hypothetical protein D9756_002194 [Leucoagaricus leucothites]